VSPKKRKREARIQTAVRLEPEILEKLRESHLSLSDEIRRRISLTLEADKYDENTRALATDVMWLADEVSRQLGFPWWSGPKAHHALGVAIQTWIEMGAPPLSAAESDLFGPDDPATLGRSVARHYRRLRLETKKNLGEVLRLDEGE